MADLKIEYVKLSEIKPYKGNAKTHPKEQVEQIKKSIQELGFNDPIGIWHNEIVEGHGRYFAAQELGLDTVPVIRLDGLTDEQRRAYTLIHNKLTMNSDFDFDILSAELDDIFDIDMSDFGFDLSLDDEEPQEVIEDEVPEEVETRCKLGDLWILGNHRLICGDSTDVNVIDRLMDGVKADMVFTDSPYGINAVNDDGVCVAYGDNHVAQRGKYAKVIGDDTTETAQQAYDIYSQLCDKMILWGGNYFLDFLPPSDGWLIWDKRGESGIRNTFADGEMAWCSFHTPVRIYHQLWNGMIREGEHEKRVHPTQKPIRMLSEILQDFTNEGDIILDVFGGSGSTLIACEQTGRTCYMAELSPEYVDVIIARYEKLTGNKAVLLT